MDFSSVGTLPAMVGFLVPTWGAMKISASERLLRPVVGACLTLLACLVVAPSNAQAGCSSRVSHGSEYALGADLIEQAFRLGDQSPLSPRLPQDLPRPCSGPTCSKLPAIPAPPSVAETRTVESWAYHGGALISLPALDARLLPPPPRDLHTIHVGPSVFHPPRRHAFS